MFGQAGDDTVKPRSSAVPVTVTSNFWLYFGAPTETLATACTASVLPSPPPPPQPMSNKPSETASGL
ncbi:MAG: hypothetical protein H7242_01960 [Microbacteriaceae bacterium]|nr:hypothetical protein [Burkholderiaceae bacterium]